MKKVLALILALVMCLSFAACGGNTDTETPTSEAAQADTTQVDATTEEATQAETTAETTVENTTEKPATTVHTHSWKKATCKAPKTCKTCGVTEGAAAEHNWKNATCT